jgi:hypothetical protein
VTSGTPPSRSGRRCRTEASDPRLVVGSVAEQRENLEQNADLLRQLADVLLAHGGTHVVVPHDTPEAAAVLMKLVIQLGETFDPTGLTVELGEESELGNMRHPACRLDVRWAHLGSNQADG